MHYGILLSFRRMAINNACITNRPLIVGGIAQPCIALAATTRLHASTATKLHGGHAAFEPPQRVGTRARYTTNFDCTGDQTKVACVASA
jgi:hypothetical protein